MSIATQIESIGGHLRDAYNAVIARGGVLPGQLNLSNLTAAVDSIPTNTLAGLKAALKNGTAQSKFPVGYEIPDKYAGNDNPLIVAQYLDSSNNSTYGNAEGVILTRKYVEPFSAFGNTNYIYSTLRNFLNSSYIDKCSNECKDMISDISISYYNGSVLVSDSCKFFAMSVREIFGVSNHAEGVKWEYWKEKTGLSSVNNNANAGRILRNRAGAARIVWLRSYYANNQAYCVDTDGRITYDHIADEQGVLPACFISKD